MSNKPTTELVQITVDGKTYEAPKGENLLKVLKDNNISVPHYCYHPGLSVAGACRMCFVEVSGAPKPIISCNAQVNDGMKVDTQTETVKKIQKWNLAFHLINHPLDCPICDQAGECGLQDYYMEHGQYNSDMHEEKVTKRKVISIGEHVMLDTERCILCSRCVRFFDEVPKTSEMAIFNRGDKAEIGTYLDKDLDNNYTLNSVNICPVGALTSKDFRFKKRVWFLKKFKSICPGCSTGCNVEVHEDPNENQAFRMLPRYNAEVNGYWMCDYGAMRYKSANPDNRILSAQVKKQRSLCSVEWSEAKEIWKQTLKADPSDIAVLITPQYTQEEFQTIYDFFTESIQCKNIYHTVDSQKIKDQTITDELLMRADKNPNALGLFQKSKAFKLQKNDLSQFQSDLEQSKWKVLVVFAPEDAQAHPDFLNSLGDVSEINTKILIGTQVHYATSLFDLILPTLSFAEKSGTFVNYKEMNQTIESGAQLVEQAKAISDILCS